MGSRINLILVQDVDEKNEKKIRLPIRPKVRQSSFAKSIYAAIRHNVSIFAENPQLPITSTNPSKQVPLKLLAFDMPKPQVPLV